MITVPRLLIVDTETGGLDPQKHSILSLGAVVWDSGVSIDIFEALIVEPEIVADTEAIIVNKIDLDAHRLNGITPSEAVKQFMAFLDKNFGILGERAKIDLVGHNISFDAGFIRRLFSLAGTDFESCFSHRVLDTAGILRFLILAGKLPIKGAGLDEALAHFKIIVQRDKRHTALGDAVATAQLLNELLKIVR